MIKYVKKSKQQNVKFDKVVDRIQGVKNDKKWKANIVQIKMINLLLIIRQKNSIKKIIKSKFIKEILTEMGTQQSNTKTALSSTISLPQPGYRITNLDPSINANGFKLNIMTDYVIGSDPRFLDLKKLHQLNQVQVQFEVFSILDYRVRKVYIPIQKHQVQSVVQVQNLYRQVQIMMDQQKSRGFTLHSCKQFTLGINFKLYPKINDTILRISKVFKNSPLQTAQIKKDQYIVGMIEGDFNSMKSFVDLVKMLIHSQFQYITLAICSAQGITRLQKVAVKELQKWKDNYGIGFLGVELAEGWLNKWQLKKHIDANKKKLINSNGKVINQPKISPQDQNQKGDESQLTKESLINYEELSSLAKGQKITYMREEVDFMIQGYTISHEKEKQQSGFTQPKQSLAQKQIPFRKEEQTLQLGIKSKSNLEESFKQKILQQKTQQKPSQKTQQKPQQKPQQISEFPKQPSNIQQMQDSNSQISSNQIEQKCNELQQGNYEGKTRQMNVIKKSKNIVEINFKDDASTICMCKDYTKHCEKCFKEKQGNYLFFNKKTNRIILIEKAMLFPKKN